MLSLLVAYSDVRAEIPKTSQRILMSDFIAMLIGLSAAVTLFDMGILWFSRSSPRASVIVKFTKPMTASRAIDLASFLFVVDYILVIFIYSTIIAA